MLEMHLEMLTPLNCSLGLAALGFLSSPALFFGGELSEFLGVAKKEELLI